MGWFLGCFKCRQRHPTGSSINLKGSCKDGRRVSSSAGLPKANSAQAKDSTGVEKVLSVQGDEKKRNSSACMKMDRRSRSAKRPSTEQLLQVEKLEEEIDSLNMKLLEEANQATNLSNEVRHLRNCSALLDSPNAFRKALNALEQALEKGHVEESQPLLYLQSLLSKIEPLHEVIEVSSEERDEERQPKGSFECMDVSSSSTIKERKSLEKAQDKVQPDQSQGSIFTPVTISREPDEGQRFMPRDEQSTCSSSQLCSPDIVGVDAKKTHSISVVTRRSSTTLSFSGFLLVEDVTKERPISDKVAVERFSSTEFSVTKIIEKTDTSSENLVEASKSLFAFSTDSSQGHSTLTTQALFGTISKEVTFPNSDSDAESCSEKPEGGSFSNLHYRSPKCLWSLQDDNTYELDRLCCSLSTEQCQIGANSHNGFSGADALSLFSTSCRNSISSCSLDSEESDSQHGTKGSSSKVRLQMHIPSVNNKVSAKKNVNSHAPVQALSMSQPEDIISDAGARSSTDIQAESVTGSMDKLCQRCAASVDPLDGCIAQEAGFEVKHSSSIFDTPMRNKTLEKTNQGKATSSENLICSSFNRAPLKVVDKSTSNEEDSSHTTSPSLSQGGFSILRGEAIVELSSPGTTSIGSPDTEFSSYAVHTPSPFRPVGGIKEGCPSDFLSETPSTPISVNSHESRLPLDKEDARKPQFTPLRTPSTSRTQAETPSTTTHSQGSPSSINEDRPILGTVAAHWNHSSISSQKWWDGKGIPNSTNKYKEDQKVSWHATPFEVRLERALAKQGRVFQKKLFTGAMATEMEAGV